MWLLEAARAVIDESALGSIRLARWDRVPHDAEANHLAPLLDVWLRTHDHNAPEAVVHQLRALALRHAAWHRTRTAALLEILGEFDRLSIDALVLKGAALAWMIYPSPSLRPMVDLDLLVPRARAGEAQAALGRLGFGMEPEPGRFRRNAHHLPVAQRLDDGLPVNVEIHVDALSRDAPSTIATSNLTEPPQPFMLNGTRRLTLGHLDMLRHLTHHLLEPSPNGRVRLIGIVDLLSYACAFHERIDWRRLQSDFGFVTNALACLHHLVPLPDTLMRFAPVRRQRCARSRWRNRAPSPLRPHGRATATVPSSRSCSTRPAGGCTRFTTCRPIDRSHRCASFGIRGNWHAGSRCEWPASECAVG